MSDAALETHGLSQELRRAARRQRHRFPARARARATRSSAPTAPARPPSSISSPARSPPSDGRILLDGADITGLGQAQRVKRGLVRTFQITALFRGLTVLENVTLAVGERLGVAGEHAAPRGLAPRRHRGGLRAARSARHRRRGAAAGARARLWPAAPRRDRRRAWPRAQGAAARRAGGRRAVGRERHHHRGDRAAAAGDRRCSSSSTTWIWSSAWRGASPCWCRARCWSKGTPTEIAADARVRQVYLGEREPA